MDISSATAILGVLSLSVERVVEMIKNLSSWLSQKQEDEKMERYRRLTLHAIAAFVGFVIALTASEQIESVLFKTSGQLTISGCIILGLLASGGSGFWNQSLGIVEEIKRVKKLGGLKSKP
ncbi:MAG: hypothetical protein ABIA11_01865 [Patescibacteria group bacterium]